MDQFQVKGRTLVIRMPKELDHYTTGQIPGIADRMMARRIFSGLNLIFETPDSWTAQGSE